MGRRDRKIDKAEIAERAAEARVAARELAGEGGEALRDFAQSTGKAARDFATTAVEAAKELLETVENAGDRLNERTQSKKRRRGRKLLGLVALGAGVVLAVNEKARNALTSAIGRGGDGSSSDPWSTSEPLQTTPGDGRLTSPTTTPS